MESKLIDSFSWKEGRIFKIIVLNIEKRDAVYMSFIYASVAVGINQEQLYIETALRHGCSPVNLMHIFRTPFPKNTSEWLLLINSKRYQRNCFLSFWKRDKVSFTILADVGILILVLVFLWNYLLLCLLWEVLHYIESIWAFHEKNY